MSENPVFQRLVRQHTLLTREASARLTRILAIIATTLALIALLVDPTLQTLLVAIPYLILGIAAVGALLTPPLVLLLTCILVGREVLHEDFDLLRITQIKSESILRGYLDAANARMEIIWALSKGLIPAIAVALAHQFVALWSDSPSWVLSNLGNFLLMCSLALILAIIVLATVGFAVYAFWYVALRLGVWIGIRWGSNAATVGGIVFAIAAALTIAGIAALGPWTLLCCFMPFIFPVGSLVLGDTAMRRALKVIENR